MMTEPTPEVEPAAQPGPPPGPVADLETQVAALVAATGLDAATVRKLLTAQTEQAGENVGTIRFNAETGAVAHRVRDGDVVKWRISHPTDGMVYEMAPTKSDWTRLTSA